MCRRLRQGPPQAGPAGAQARRAREGGAREEGGAPNQGSKAFRADLNMREGRTKRH